MFITSLSIARVLSSRQNKLATRTGSSWAFGKLEEFDSDLVKLLTAHYNPTPSETIQRFKFYSRVCKTDETVAT